MFRASRPLFNSFARQASTVSKQSTGIFGLAVHSDPIPALQSTYKETLAMLSTIPPNAAYRQSVEASLTHKLGLLENSKGDVAAVENQLGEGQIEEVLEAAQAELRLVGKMIEWKAYVCVTLVFIRYADAMWLGQMGTIRDASSSRPVGILQRIDCFASQYMSSSNLLVISSPTMGPSIGLFSELGVTPGQPSTSPQTLQKSRPSAFTQPTGMRKAVLSDIIQDIASPRRQENGCYAVFQNTARQMIFTGL